MPGRTIIVANRIPYTPRHAGRRLVLERSAGGLATGMRAIHDGSDSLWIGSLPPEPGASRARIRRVLEALEGARVRAVQLSAAEQEGFYEDVSNAVLWPVLHSNLDRIPLEVRGWDAYRSVNRRFAEAVAESYRPGDTVWVHDYQLMLVPRLVRDLLPGARIGFFLHIPFPSPDVFRSLPWRTEILEGLLGADLVGFHVPAYMANFVATVRDLAGLETDVDDIVIDDRNVRVGVFPLGIDAAYWSELGSSPEVVAAAAAMRDEAHGQRLILGVDRLDYTKGIPRRLLALDRLLERHPELREGVRLVQVAVPSRETVESYAALRRQVDELVGRINGRWGTASWAPVHYIYRSLDDSEVAGLYRAADVMVVSPVRDGMNLVAKEFVATRVDGDGVLVLSEFAGAASELGSAIRVNPFDVDGVADAIAEALALRPRDRHRRMSRLRARVAIQTAQAWADGFMAALASATGNSGGRPVGPGQLAEMVSSACRSGAALHLVLDYDGTLVPFYPEPGDARPDAGLLRLISTAALSPGVLVDIVSGRRRWDLEAWLGRCGAGLYAEHGAWTKPRGASAWARLGAADDGWRPGVDRLLSFFLETTPASLREAKGSSVAWHYRGSDERPDGLTAFGEIKARELRAMLAALLAGAPAHAVPGSKVVEVVGSGATKAAAVTRAVSGVSPAVVVAVGDDRTDEDMFRALPPESWTVKVGPGPTRARFRLADCDEVRRFLALLLEAWFPARGSSRPAAAVSR